MSINYFIPQILPDDRARARREHPITSHEAADASAASVTASQRAVVRIFQMAGCDLTAVEVEQRAARIGLPYSAARIRSAIPELGERGVLELIGTIRREGDKRRRQLWKLVGAA